VVVPSCGDGGGGWTEEDEASFGGGSGGGHTVDLVTGDPPSGSLALDLGARVPVGLSHSDLDPRGVPWCRSQW
jgi:hypothetical protein